MTFTRPLMTLLCGWTLAAVPALGQGDTPDPSLVGLTAFSASGSGCPQGTMSADISEDRQAITVAFSSFQVEALGYKKTRSFLPAVAHCLMNLTMAVPKGYAMFLQYIDTRGYLSLTKGSYSEIVMDYGVSGDGNWVRSGNSIWNTNRTGPNAIFGGAVSRIRQMTFKIFNGPFDGDYIHRASINEKAYDKASCSRTGKLAIGINTNIALRNMDPNNSALFTVDTQDGLVTSKINVTWKKCKV